MTVLGNWVTQLRKGVLELCVLNTLHGSRAYGYDIVRRLRPVEGLVIGEGTIYPLLSRLRREGVLNATVEESAAGPPRKFYALTRTGHARLRAMNSHWDKLSGSIAALRKNTR